MNDFFTGSFMFDPLNNFLFYKIMGEKGDEVQLLSFINAVLGKTGDDRFTSIEILEDKTFTPNFIGGKTGILDVRAVLHGDKRVNVEVQLQDNHNIDRRSLFYLSKEYTSKLKAGQDYIELPDIIGINIVNFNFPNTKNYHSSFHLREDTERDIILTTALEIHYINMVKYRKQGDSNLSDPLCRWLTWLDKNSSPELVKEAVKMDDGIQLAAEKLLELGMVEDARDAYFRYFMDQCDRTSELNYALSKGREEGREQNRQYFLELLNQGLTVEEIKQRLEQF
jgi:predicted transposase/invertase (TIGR01784 family)